MSGPMGPKRGAWTRPCVEAFFKLLEEITEECEALMAKGKGDYERSRTWINSRAAAFFF